VDTNLQVNLLEALRLLWLGKVASFILETTEWSMERAEKKIEEEARVFEEFKSFLLEVY
jgi:hypothetical protein